MNYIIEQVHAFRDGDRVDTRTGRMVLASKALSEKELREAAEYYAAIGPDRQQWVKTVVSTEVPKGPAPFGVGGFRYHAPEGGMEPLPAGIVVTVAEDDDLVRARDQINGGFVQYVHPEDMALGEKVAATYGGCRARAMAPTTRAWAMCLGSPMDKQVYMIRQLKDMQTGARKDKNVAVMKPIVDKLSDREMVAVSAYLASREP